MPLDPQTYAMLKRIHAINLVLAHDMDPVQVRNRERALTQLAASHTSEPVAHIENRYIPGPIGDIPLRIYTPQGQNPSRCYFISTMGVGS